MLRRRPSILGVLMVTSLLVLVGVPWGAQAGPVDVQVLGRIFRIDARDDPESRRIASPEELLKALPGDLADARGAPPSDDEVLAEVEERTWIAQFKSEDAFNALLATRLRRTPRADEFTVGAELLAAIADSRSTAVSAEVRDLYNTHAALDILTQGLRRSMKKPAESAAMHFTVPAFPAALIRSYRQQGFDPVKAYRGFRVVKAAYRSGEAALMARAVSFPLALNGTPMRVARNAGQLKQALPFMMQPKIKEVVAQQKFEDLFVRDQGAMFGNGELWMGPSVGMFQIKTVNYQP